MTIRAAAARSLASVGIDALPAVPELVRAARSGNPDLSRSALWTVARLPGVAGDDAYRLFLELLGDEDSERRRLGVEGLTSMGRQAGGSAARLLSLTLDENQYVRALSLKALHGVAPDYPGFVDAVVRALSDPEDVVRHEASYLVYDMSEPPSAVAAPLGEMITDKYVSDRVNHILSRMGPRAAPAVLAVASALGRKDAKIAYNAAFTLSRIGNAAAPALDALIAALEHDDPYVRRYSAQAIGNIGPEADRAVAALESLSGDKDSHVRSSAKWALNRIRKGS
jgi:HEAT repeat protein